MKEEIKKKIGVAAKLYAKEVSGADDLLSDEPVYTPAVSYMATEMGFISGAEFRDSLASEEQAGDKDKEIERLKGLIKKFWFKEYPHTDFAGHTDGEKMKEQERVWDKYQTNNL